MARATTPKPSSTYRTPENPNHLTGEPNVRTRHRVRSPNGNAQPTVTTRPESLPSNPPSYASLLAQDIGHLRGAAGQRLDRLKGPMSETLNTFAMIVKQIERNEGLAARQLNRARNAGQPALRMAIAGELKRLAPDTSQSAALIERDVQNRFEAESVVSYVQTAQQAGGESHSMIARQLLSRLGDLENAVARMRLDALDIGRDADGLDLEGLLRQQHLLADLETRPSEQLLDYFQNLLALDRKEARRLEAPLLRLARQRCEPVKATKRAREAEPREAERERLASLRLRQILEGIREQRIGPELGIYESEFRPQIVALVRKTIGIDPSELDDQLFAEFTRSYRFGQRLDKAPIRSTWHLRGALVALPPNVRRHLPANLFT